ncbi:IS4 family transposase [Methylicorpusculum sp.]|uniref:IS4 family transposase n=1 Tax=Methylicorpusculum sp. TaxID=2713644 RepID=UPI0027234647|nr:IS4 family transposase [Methylicorpusculum sp.]MDO8845736.1 IS4 family transposase [Methylicorpusculum sp.]
MSSETFKLKHRLSENSFTRTRKLSFPTLIAYFLNLTKGSYQQELDTFFSLSDTNTPPTQVVTKSALCQARKQLSPLAFIDLNRHVVDTYFAAHPELKTWHGFRLCAIDGSKLRVPNEPDIVAAFGVNPGKENQKDCPLALASVYYDVLNHISIDASINPTTASELDCAAAHLNYAHPKDLSILDRGYNAFWLYALYEATGRYFCMRARSNQGLLYKQFAESGEAQAEIILEANPRSVKQCLKKGLPTQPLKLRLIRVELNNGEVEVLITNLMAEQAFPVDEFKELYHLRWGAEIDQPYCLHKSVFRKLLYRFCNWFYPGTINSPQFT